MIGNGSCSIGITFGNNWGVQQLQQLGLYIRMTPKKHVNHLTITFLISRDFLGAKVLGGQLWLPLTYCQAARLSNIL